MKRIVCYIIGDLEFIRLIVREFFLYLIGERSKESAYNNIKWIQQGGYEFECMIDKYRDIPTEIAFSYINHAHKCIYEMEE